MPLFAIIGHDVADSGQKRRETRPMHLDRLHKLNEQKRLIVAGPTPIEHGADAMSGSLVIAEFDDLAEAKAWAEADPYLEAGVYSHVNIKPFIQVLPSNS